MILTDLNYSDRCWISMINRYSHLGIWLPLIILIDFIGLGFGLSSYPYPLTCTMVYRSLRIQHRLNPSWVSLSSLLLFRPCSSPPPSIVIKTPPKTSPQGTSLTSVPKTCSKCSRCQVWPMIRGVWEVLLDLTTRV